MSKIAEGYKQTEVGVIPSDWEVKKLSDISNMKSGDSITSKRIFEIDSYPCYGGNGLRGYTSKYTHDGDYALIGRQGALCGNVQFVMDKFFASEHAVVVTPKTNTDIKWLYYMLIDMNLNQYSESSAQPGLSVSKILNLPIHLPPAKAEQTAIATALNDADALITQLEKLLAKKRNIKQGAMQKLLNPYEENDEKRMENGELKMVNEKGNSQFTTRHLQLKKGWEMKKLGDIGSFKGGSGFPTKSQGRKDERIPFYKVSDMNLIGNEIFMSNSNNWISEQTVKHIGAYCFPSNTIVFAKIGAAIYLERKKTLSMVSCIDNNIMGFIVNAEAYALKFIYYLPDFALENVH